ncbi:DUF362 domain-containing protein [Dethiosulfatarculus sandiegensis]|uniref:(4Fe-4S)-binding protein n=1 Tax=Dethiosulfatarculus sandiegensis TaxID=1429043 RepID=A0A0D2J6Q1_9BACT|nr:DUF362 domain-containing protein [Dethiosulfatarculus sandiegensis]KIX11356.1 (4Fe-4S)-binding protein [Dethiosulfatarculus sandiegensis]
MQDTVSLVRCPDYDKRNIRKSLDAVLEPLGGITAFVKSGQRVLLKPNLLSPRPLEQRVVTDPVLVEAVARMVLEAGARPFIADSPALEPFAKIVKVTGLDRIAGELGISVRELKDPRPIPSNRVALFKNLEIAADAMEADQVINLPKLKTHCQMLLTLGVKNLFGVIVAQRKAEWHGMVGASRRTFASLLLDINQAVNPGLTILDGVWGMEGHGPSNGRPRHFGVLAASKNALALDMTMCRLLGVSLEDYPLYLAARERGAPELEQDAVKVLAPGIEMPLVTDLELPQLGSMEMLPGFLTSFSRRYLVSKPVQDKKACRLCGKCVRICPVNCLEILQNRMTFDYDRCIRCYCCQEVCPENAISFKKGLLAKVLKGIGR